MEREMIQIIEHNSYRAEVCITTVTTTHSTNNNIPAAAQEGTQGGPEVQEGPQEVPQDEVCAPPQEGESAVQEGPQEGPYVLVYTIYYI